MEAVHVFVAQGAFHQLMGVGIFNGGGGSYFAAFRDVFPWDQLEVVCLFGNFQVALPIECGILNLPTVLLPVCSP